MADSKTAPVIEYTRLPHYFTIEQQADFEKLSYEKNPTFAFQEVDPSILAMIATGQIDPRAMAMKQLANKGLNECGQYVGFDKAQRIFESNVVQNPAIL